MREISGSPHRIGRRSHGRSGIRVPDWFARELEHIDDRYYVEWDNLNHYYRIVLDSEQLVDEGGKIAKIIYPLTRAVFDAFDMRVVHDMQKRKWIGRHFRSNAHYYAWLKEQQRIEKEKKHLESVDMMTEGIIKMDRMERTKTFTY